VSLSDEDLNGLGLLLVGRIAENVSHVHIGGYTFISFRLPVE